VTPTGTSARHRVRARPHRGSRTVATLSVASTVQAGANTLAALWATRVLGPGPRGVMVIALTVATTCALLGGVGAGSAYRSELAQAEPDRRERLASSYGLVALAGSLLAAVIAVAAGVGSAGIVDPALGSPGVLTAIALATIAQTVAGLTTEAWFADGRFRPAGGWAALSALAGLLALLAVSMVRPGPAGMLAAQAGAGLAASAFSVRGLLRVGALARPGFGCVRQLVARGWPALGFGVGITLALRVDRYLLGVFVGPVAVTVYSLAATLAEVPRMLPQAFGQLLSRRIAEGQGVSPDRPVAAAGVAVVLSATVLGVFSWYAIPALFGPELTAARQYLVLLLVAEVLFTPFTVAAKGLVGGGWTATIGLVGCLGSVVAVGSFCLFALPFGLWGACVACCLTYLTLSVLALGSLRRLLRVRDRRLAPAHRVPPLRVGSRWS
jgi:O-antigen/teichoic acid export membrane protein